MTGLEICDLVFGTNSKVHCGGSVDCRDLRPTACWAIASEIRSVFIFWYTANEVAVAHIGSTFVPRPPAFVSFSGFFT